jgi:nitroimidazol reductase NimA-like FMN-containing flavoprotein (pyridoxamine 5'-phosphate oxidase superfamily)
MDSNGLALEHLSRDECMRLMATAPVGRIVYTRQAMPAVELVNFALADGAIVIRTDAGSRLAVATSGAVVAFEADSVDADRRSGWSVTAIGCCQAVTDEVELRRLRKLGLQSWAPGRQDYLMKISPVIVTGRLLGTSHCGLGLRV